MCDDKLRDGATEQTIARNNDDDYTRGRHESAAYYEECAATSRNFGLYTSNQLNANKKTAVYTRQNNNANRYAYECPEERDYYPYWRPSPWRDIAIITTQPRRCEAYRQESENVKGRGRCTFLGEPNGPYPISQDICEATLDKDGVAGVWVPTPPHGLDAPECLQAQFTRDNHLGNTAGGYLMRYNWTLPRTIHENCSLRMRYNITALDMDGFANATSVQAGWDSNNNAGEFPLERYNFPDQAQAAARGYTLTGNPKVDIFGSIIPDTAANKAGFKLQHNVNTNQYPRAFQDRSHRFSIRSRQGKYSQDAIIHNVNVGGKRGNIVQTFPATEYVYMPSKMDLTVGDYVHFQWTGSNSNPGNNDGQGTAGTDRSNVVMLQNKTYIDTKAFDYSTALHIFGHQAANYPAKVDTNPLNNFLGWDRSTLMTLAFLNTVQYGGDIEELDDAGTYFDLPPKQVNRLGIFNYMCTRNNNFSNRSQKGQIRVDVSRAATSILGVNGGRVIAQKASKSSLLKTAYAELRVEPEEFESATPISVTIAPQYILRDYSVNRDDLSSDVVFVSSVQGSEGQTTLPGKVQLRIKHSGSPISDTYIAYLPTMSLDKDAKTARWEKIDGSKTSGSVAYATVNKPGVYIVKSELRIGIVIAIVAACIFTLVGAILLIIFCKSRAEKTAMRLAAEKV
eukprot:UN00334